MQKKVSTSISLLVLILLAVVVAIFLIDEVQETYGSPEFVDNVLITK